MKKLVLSIAILALTTSVYAEDHTANPAEKTTEKHSETKHEAPHWGYDGEGAPAHWGELSDKFKLCATGVNQSPINIKSHFDVELPAIKFDYTGKANSIINNGHTIQVNIADGSSITSEGTTFSLKQFHFHTPSENTIDGKSFPLEAHFVHHNAETNTYAVVAVVFNEGDENPILKSIWDKMPAKAGNKTSIDKGLAYSDLMPKEKDYYRFNGSFTTPPCTEGVKWLVLKQPMSVSKAQVEQFFKVMQHPNNRPVQKTGARVIVD